MHGGVNVQPICTQVKQVFEKYNWDCVWLYCLDLYMITESCVLILICLKHFRTRNKFFAFTYIIIISFKKKSSNKKKQQKKPPSTTATITNATTATITARNNNTVVSESNKA